MGFRASLIDSNAIHSPDVVHVVDRMGLELQLPEITTHASGGSRNEDHLRPVQREYPRSLREVAVVTDQDPECDVERSREGHKARVTRSEVVLLDTGKCLHLHNRYVALTIDPDQRAVRANDWRCVVEKSIKGLLVDRSNQDGAGLAGQIDRHAPPNRSRYPIPCAPVPKSAWRR